jgi:hypothetical protein
MPEDWRLIAGDRRIVGLMIRGWYYYSRILGLEPGGRRFDDMGTLQTIGDRRVLGLLTGEKCYTCQWIPRYSIMFFLGPRGN